jgi:hypothetical protein
MTAIERWGAGQFLSIPSPSHIAWCGDSSGNKNCHCWVSSKSIQRRFGHYDALLNTNSGQTAIELANALFLRLRLQFLLEAFKVLPSQPFIRLSNFQKLLCAGGQFL